MIRFPGYLILVLCLSACNQQATNPNVRPSTSSSDVAIANLRLGTAYMTRGEYEKALDKLEKALDADPGYYATHGVLGVLHQRLGQKEKAEKYFKRSLRIAPNEASTLNNYGQFLCSIKRLEEAEEAFIKAANNPLYETPEIANTNAGTCAMLNGKTAEAETHFRTALRQNPRVPAALIQMAQINLEQGNHLSARGYLQRYQEVAPSTAKSLWLGVQVETELGDMDSVSSNALLLKNNFPDSKEAQLLRESGIQ